MSAYVASLIESAAATNTIGSVAALQATVTAAAEATDITGAAADLQDSITELAFAADEVLVMSPPSLIIAEPTVSQRTIVALASSRVTRS